MSASSSNEEQLVFISEGISVDIKGRIIYLRKDSMTPEDKVSLRFSEVLNNLGIKYAVVAGYVAILFGRARRSDDIDFICEYLSLQDFIRLARILKTKGYVIMQGEISEVRSLTDVYRRYLCEGYSIRFMYDDVIIPNIEFKLASNTLQSYSIEHAYQVIINNSHTIKIAPLELQIAYKVYLGSSKDLGDAVFIYELFKQIISTEELNKWCKELEVDCNWLTRK